MPGRIPGVEDLLGRVKAKVYVHKAESEFLRGFGSDLVAVDNHSTLAIGRLTLNLHAHARAHAGLPVLPDRRPARVGRHALHRLMRAHRPVGQRSGSDVPLAHAAPRRAAGLHASLPRSQLRGPSSTIGDEKRGNPFMRFASLGDFLRTMGGGRIVRP